MKKLNPAATTSRAIWIDPKIGVGDAVQFTSIPENFFHHTGTKIIDMAKHWVFDFNPYVERDVSFTPNEVFNPWGSRPFIAPEMPYYMSTEEARSRVSTYTCNAEIHASFYGMPIVLNRPRLYCYENFPFQERHLILIHTTGRSHGEMPKHVIDHVLEKYKGMDLAQVGLPTDIDIGLPKIETQNPWELAEIISQCRMFIGMDSGPSWIAACYPDVVVKRLRTMPDLKRLKDWIPLDVENMHSHWDDRAIQVYNVSEEDVGFTQSYKRL